MSSVLLDVPEKIPPRKTRFGRRSVWHTWLALGLRLIFLALIAGLALGGWYLARKGFGREWRARLVDELHKRGVEVSVRRLTLDPFRGLVARDVRIFDHNHNETTLALISEVSFDINYAALLNRQPFLNAIDVRDAQITFPFQTGDAHTPPAELKRFRAHVYFPPEQIYVSQAEGIFCGVRISATGQLLHRANPGPSTQISEAEWQQRIQLLQRVVTELNQLQFPAALPQLQIKFSGDLSDLENARVESSLRAERVRRGHYEIRNFAAVAEWSDQKLNITQCEWRDDFGGFVGRAGWNRQTNAADFQMRSTLDAKSLLQSLGFVNLLGDASFQSPPFIEMSGNFSFAGAEVAKTIIGRVALRDFTYRTVPLTGLKADFAWDGIRAMVRNLQLRHASGELTADLLDAPNDFRLDLDSSINPSAARALAPADFTQFLSEWDFAHSPIVHLVIRGPNRQPGSWIGDGTVTAQRARFRGVTMNSAASAFHFADGATTFDNLRVTRDEGVGTGSFTYDFKKHEVRVTNVKTSLRPAEAIFWIEPHLANAVAPYKFRQPPNLTANGVVQFHGGKNTRLDISVDAPNGMDYGFLGKTLPFDRVSARLLFTDDRLRLNEVEGALFSGIVRGTADISLAKNDPHYRANLEIDGVDFPLLTDLYFKYQTAHGRMSGSYDFTGLGDDARTMRGAGKIQVTNGNVFAIPIFGPLSELIAHLVPGVGYSVAHNASAGFSIQNGIARVDNFKVAGRLFGMLGHGDIYFLDDKLNFDVRINANGPGVLLTPMYKLFEYTGEGTLSKPVWRPKRF